MTELTEAWGAGPTQRYEALAARFRPLFDRIGEGAAARERDRTPLFMPSSGG